MTKPPKPEPPPPPANAPTKADSSVVSAGLREDAAPFTSLVSTGPQGLQRKAATAKRTLLGGTAP